MLVNPDLKLTGSTSSGVLSQNTIPLAHGLLRQFIVSPATSTGKIVINISGLTDATTTDAYFYIDDFSILYPAGTKLDLGGMDIWDNALPVIPPISTVLSALDVWSAVTSLDYGAGTMGESLKKKLALGQFMGLK